MMILSAATMVDNLCAIMITVLFFNCSRNVSWIYFSFSVSRFDTASSKITIGVSRNSVRAIDILCRCPPESRYPRSPVTVSYPSGSSSINSAAFAFAAASRISSSEASVFPIRIFSFTLSWNKYVSCCTAEIISLRDAIL